MEDLRLKVHKTKIGDADSIEVSAILAEMSEVLKDYAKDSELGDKLSKLEERLVKLSTDTKGSVSEFNDSLEALTKDIAILNNLKSQVVKLTENLAVVSEVKIDDTELIKVANTLDQAIAQHLNPHTLKQELLSEGILDLAVPINITGTNQTEKQYSKEGLIFFNADLGKLRLSSSEGWKSIKLEE